MPVTRFQIGYEHSTGWCRAQLTLACLVVTAWSADGHVFSTRRHGAVHDTERNFNAIQTPIVLSRFTHMQRRHSDGSDTDLGTEHWYPTWSAGPGSMRIRLYEIHWLR